MFALAMAMATTGGRTPDSGEIGRLVGACQRVDGEAFVRHVHVP
jgi:hypothetical protein